MGGSGGNLANAEPVASALAQGLCAGRGGRGLAPLGSALLSGSAYLLGCSPQSGSADKTGLRGRVLASRGHRHGHTHCTWAEGAHAGNACSTDRKHCGKSPEGPKLPGRDRIRPLQCRRSPIGSVADQAALRQDFRLDSLRNVLGFFAAAGVGPAISAIVATAGFVLFYNSSAPVPTTWLNWFASDALGIIMVAPLLIGLGGLAARDAGKMGVDGRHVDACSARRSERNGLRIAGALLVVHPPSAWSVPACAAGRALPAGVCCCGRTYSRLRCGLDDHLRHGDLGGLSSLPDRAHAARATLLAISIYTLVLAALFAERRHNERALEDSNNRLKGSNHRLQLALGGAELGVWSVDTATGRFESDARDRQIHGYPTRRPAQNACRSAAFHSSRRPTSTGRRFLCR